MAKNKHLTLEERFEIANGLEKNLSFKAIGTLLERDCTTISKEIRSHLVVKQTGAFGLSYNSCVHRTSCDHRLLCSTCKSKRKLHFCRFCKFCNQNCPDFKQYFCPKLSKAPYVCNGCEQLKSCTLEKHFYHAAAAYTEYKDILSESRSGITYSEQEIQHLDSVISPLILKGQSLNHICANNQDSIMCSGRTLYRLVDYNLFSARNIDLPRKVRYKVRKKKSDFKVDRACRQNRTYADFQNFISINPDLPITEIDSVEGNKGGKVLLTIHFVKAECMLAFIRESNDSQSVINIFNKLYLEIGPDVYCNIFPILLGDNGSEFSNPNALEFDGQDNQRSHVFYCDPSAPHQKGSAEKNHTFIRYFVSKGESFNSYTQADISLMMDHINSYCRASLGNKTPYEMMEFLYGATLLDHLGCHKIPANDVTMNKSIWKKEDNRK